MNLYEKYHTTDDSSLNEKRIKKLHKYVDSMTHEQRLSFANIIIEYKTEKTHEECNKLPYGGCENEEGVNFPIEKLPNNLLQILYKYAQSTK